MAVNAGRRAAARVAVIDVASIAELAPGVLAETDMLVFVADAAMHAIDAERTLALAAAAREGGVLVAAIVANPDRQIGRSAVLTALRDAADMVMIVRDAADAEAVIAALR